jgi:hypothetical protein
MEKRVLILAVSLMLISIFLSGCGQTTTNVYSPPTNMPACTDSDGGKEALVAGTCATSDYSMTDFCTEKGQVEEYFCNPQGGCDSAAMDCPSGNSCSNGACVKA